MMRIGFSKDIHRFGGKKPFKLCGVLIESKKGIIAHSDGDVAYHAIAESILGALSLNDLGYYFPDSDDSTENMDSSLIVDFAIKKSTEMGYKVSNIDVLIELENIKLKPYIENMKNNVAKVLKIETNQVSIKAATNEKCDSIGKGKACVVYSNVLLEKL